MIDFTIYGIGDSHMDGAYIPLALETKVQALLEAAYPGRPWSFIDIVHTRALGAITTDHMITYQLPIVLVGGEVGGVYYPPFPEYVAIWGGVNDIVSVPPHSAVEIEANLQTMYTACHNAGVKVIAITMPPNRYSGWNAVMQAVNAWIMSAAPLNVDYKIDTWGVSPNGLEDPAHLKFILESYLYYPYPPGTDGVHMSHAGYNVVAAKMFAGVAWKTTINQTIDLGEVGSMIPQLIPYFKTIENIGTWGVDIDLRELFDQTPPSGNEVNWFLTQQTVTPLGNMVTFSIGSNLIFPEYVLRTDWIHEAFDNVVAITDVAFLSLDALITPYTYYPPGGDVVNFWLERQDALGNAYPVAYDEINWFWPVHFIGDLESVGELALVLQVFSLITDQELAVERIAFIGEFGSLNLNWGTRRAVRVFAVTPTNCQLATVASNEAVAISDKGLIGV